MNLPEHIAGKQNCVSLELEYVLLKLRLFDFLAKYIGVAWALRMETCRLVVVDQWALIRN